MDGNRELMQKTRPIRTFQPTFKLLEKSPRVKSTAVGLGMAIDVAKIEKAESRRAGLGAIIDAINDSKSCPIYNMPVIEQVRWGMQGPQTDESVKKNFGAKIDLFASGTSPEGIDFVETTMAQPGQTQTFMITCAIGLHLEPEPLCWTALGNAWTHPTVGATQPPSPDVFTQNDRFNGALGAAFAGSTPSQVIVPAVLEWGWWANYVCWHLVRGYDLRWKIGQHTNIMDECARHTAYMPVNGQQGESSSQVDVIEFIRRMNNRYESLGSALDFLKVNRIRTGSTGTNTTSTTNVGLFRPSRDDELVPVTYGGIDLRTALATNKEFRQLALPYIIKPGVPIGLYLQENDTDQADTMREYLSITQGFGGAIPPLVTDAGNVNAVPDGTGVSPVALELNSAGTAVPQQVDAERAIYKGGDLKITLAVKGFEVTEDWYNVLSSNSDVRGIVMSECGVRFAMQGS